MKPSTQETDGLKQKTALEDRQQKAHSLVTTHLKKGQLLVDHRPIQTRLGFLLFLSSHPHESLDVVGIYKRTFIDKYYPEEVIVYMGPCTCDQCVAIFRGKTYHMVLKSINGVCQTFNITSVSLATALNLGDDT